MTFVFIIILESRVIFRLFLFCFSPNLYRIHIPIEQTFVLLFHQIISMSSIAPFFQLRYEWGILKHSSHYNWVFDTQWSQSLFEGYNWNGPRPHLVSWLGTISVIAYVFEILFEFLCSYTLLAKLQSLYLHKVKTFWEGHKISHLFWHLFTVAAHFSNFCGLFRKPNFIILALV